MDLFQTCLWLVDNCFSPVSFHITFPLYVPAPKVPFLKFINVFIKFFGWHWRITLYMFQVCSSAAYHLYVAWCTHHQSLVSCCHQSFAPLSSRYPPSSLFPSGNHHAFDCVFQFVCLFCLFISCFLFYIPPMSEPLFDKDTCQIGIRDHPVSVWPHINQTNHIFRDSVSKWEFHQMTLEGNTNVQTPARLFESYL